MAKAWVIRRVKDGLFYQDESLPGDKWASSLVTANRWYDGRACSEACDPGEELVALDDAGQPAEAKAVEPAPAIAQPSPYSEDEPIPYRLTDGADKAVRARVYVASALPNVVWAAVLASQLRDRGVEVVSTWHNQRATVEAENAMAANDKARLAIKCFDEIDRADVFVWLHGESGDRVGAAVEYGYALKGAKIIYLVPLADRAAPSVFGSLGPEITTTALLRRLGGT